MIVAPIPSRESARLDALHRCQILDTPPEPAFDDLARLAAYVCRAPIAVVSLVDSTRQWFKSSVGLPFAECPRSAAFCAHTILGTDLFIVEEADADERFADHPWVVASPSIRFYAGMPLITPDGHAIGSLAVMDVVPRTLTPEQRAAMQTLANQVMAQCELRGRRSVWSLDEPDLLPDARPAAPFADSGGRKAEDDAYRWQQVFDQAEFGLAYGAISTNTFVTVNRTFARQCGYTVAELIGRPILSIYAPQEHAAMKERFPLIEREGHLTFESVHQRKDGTTFPVLVEVTVIKDAEGRPLSRVAYVKDISERKQAEEALQLAKFTVDRATDALYWVGADAKLLDVNAAACAMLGYTREEFRRMTVHDINPYFQADSWPAYWEETRRRGAASFESFHQAKDGRLIPIEVNVSFLSYQGRECHCVFVRDITGRRQVEEERARALNNLQTIMETVPDVIFALDLDGRLSKWNLRLEVVTGYAPIELSGKPALEMVPFDEAERTAAAIRRAFETGYAELEGHLLTKDGRMIPYHWTGAPFTDLQGRVIGITGVGRDVTERKKAEGMLSAEKVILEMIGADAPLPDVLVALCRMIESLSNGALCSILLLDADGVHLRHGAAPSLPDAYVRDIDGMTIGPLRGSCGTAAFTGRQIIVDDIGRDPLWDDFRDLALSHGLMACWSMPILSAAGKVLGTFAVYYRIRRSPVDELALVERASHLACLAIERTQAEAALRLTRFSIERAVDAVFWIDAQARILDINDAACLLLGYTRDELLSKTVHEIDPNFPAEAWPAYWEELKAGKSFSFEADRRKKDGTVIRTETTVNFLVHEGKEYNCAIVRDISDRKRTEGLLKFNEERFRLVAEATNDVLWDWDLVTQEHWWSPNAGEKFGYDRHAEPSITAWTDRLHPDDRERVMAIVDHALASEARTVTAEYRFRLADGSYGHFYDRGQIVRDSSGKPRRMIGAMIDVTFSKRAYASLEAAYQRLQSLSRELQTVEANERRRLSRELHDEVGQLLTALKFDLEATRQALGDNEAVSLARAHERTRRALETTDELFARLRGVVRALRPPVLEELGLKEALGAMVSDLGSRTDLMCSIALEAEAIEALTDSTMETALYRMAQELATNVARHAQAMTMSLALTVDSQYWMLRVQDDGVGFDPQAESMSGMGLRGVRERAEIFGGRVDFSSTPGAGSTVTVWIPLSAPGLHGENPRDR